MYEISVQSGFRAAHAIAMGGEVEESHEHDWEVEILLAGDTLDKDGLLCDFHVAEEALDRVIAPFRNADLNRTPPFDDLNPTAENVAHHLAERIDQALRATLGHRVSVSEVAVTEAPRCRARYRPCRVPCRVETRNP